MSSDRDDVSAVEVDASSAENSMSDTPLYEKYGDVYFYSGPIDPLAYGLITNEVAKNASSNKAVLVLVTYGGLANDAYRIARMMQDQYEHWALFCPGMCKSAGTLLSIGANELLLHFMSELGPLDVQLEKENEIAKGKSGLLSSSSFDALADVAVELYERLMMTVTLKSQGNVSFKLASDVSTQICSALLSPVYGQINPDIVGSEHRDLNVARDYALRLASVSKNSPESSIRKLVRDYPSHDFVIDFREAKELFHSVNYPEKELFSLLVDYGEAAFVQTGDRVAATLIPRPASSMIDDPVNTTAESAGLETATKNLAS